MGVIRWEEQYPGRWYGYLGKRGIADVIDFGSAVVWTLPDTLRNPDSEEFMGGTSAVSIEAAKAAVEGFVAKWMADAGLMPQLDYHNIQQRFDGLTAHNKSVFELLQERVQYAAAVSAQAEATRLEYLGCIDVIDRLHVQLADLTDENAVLKEKIGAAFGDIDDAITVFKRKVDDIVDDLGIARPWFWNVPVDEWRKAAKSKQRTEADFRNADIDANRYVTFRNGGAPDGWQLVPIEPTFDMAKAAIHLDPKCDLDAKYRAMLAAAPRYVGVAA